MNQEQIESLIASMNLREKLAQMTQLSAEYLADGSEDLITGPDAQIRLNRQDIGSIGSVLNVADARKIHAIQEKHLEDDPHKIPLIFMADIIHGHKTVYPIPLALSCSFHPKMMEDACRMAATESAASGLHVTFSPMADLCHDPRWGRVMEGTGEDPFLNTAMAASAVKGYGQSPFHRTDTLLSCVKHFAGYGASEAGREYNTVDLSKGMLMEYYMSAYKAAIDAGARMIMTSFNTIDRIPATGNRWLLRSILREQWNFDGVVITDFHSVEEMIAHGYAADGMDAAFKALMAGVDMEMMSANYLTYGEKLVSEGKIPQSYIDDAVYRILNLKNELGLFEDPFRGIDIDKERVILNSRENLSMARQAAKESMVLLKNNGILPLSKKIRLGVAGPFAKSKDILGGWALPNDGVTVSLYEGLRSSGVSEIILTAEEGLNGDFNTIGDIPEPDEKALLPLKSCDVIIAAMGERQLETGEGASKADIRLSKNQRKLLKQLKKLGIPLVVVLFSGRPMEIQSVFDDCDAFVQAWFPGVEGGNALSELLLGIADFTARMAMSVPYAVGQIPVYYNHFATGRPLLEEKSGERFVSRYLDISNQPLCCFGSGLSYADFSYGKPEVLQKQETITVSTLVKNTSSRAGTEIIQLYIHDIAASVVRPVMELKGFQRVSFDPQEEKTVIFSLSKSDFAFYNENLEKVFEPGEFQIMVGHSSCEWQAAKIYLE